MKAELHPNYRPIKVICSCNNEFETRSTYKLEDLKVEVCSECHPFFTGKYKMVDTAGKVDQFMRRYGSYRGAVHGQGEEEQADQEATKQ
jgi:large subunit ribosomal protein L31